MLTGAGALRGTRGGGGGGHPHPTLASPRLSCGSLLPLPCCCSSPSQVFFQTASPTAGPSGNARGGFHFGQKPRCPFPRAWRGPRARRAPGPASPGAPRPLSRRPCGGRWGPGRPLRSWASEMLFFHWASSQLHVVFFLQGGDAKLQVIVCVSPGQRHVAETLQSLGFGSRARQVERGRPAPRKLR